MQVEEKTLINQRFFFAHCTYPGHAMFHFIVHCRLVDNREVIHSGPVQYRNGFIKKLFFALSGFYEFYMDLRRINIYTWKREPVTELGKSIVIKNAGK